MKEEGNQNVQDITLRPKGNNEDEWAKSPTKDAYNNYKGGLNLLQNKGISLTRVSPANKDSENSMKNGTQTKGPSRLGHHETNV